VIARIMGEGQYQVEDAELQRLNRLDSALEAAVESGDEARFRSTLHELLQAVRDAGREVPDAELVDSDLILPPGDASLEEVRQLLGGEGLIPDPV